MSSSVLKSPKTKQPKAAKNVIVIPTSAGTVPSSTVLVKDDQQSTKQKLTKNSTKSSSADRQESKQTQQQESNDLLADLSSLDLQSTTSLNLDSDEDDELAERDEDGQLKPRPLTLGLIRRRCLQFKPQQPQNIQVSGQAVSTSNISNTDASSNDSSSQLLSCTHLYLDGLRLSKIDHLELFDHLTHIYLQRNCLTRIDDAFQQASLTKSLRFLVLSNNQLTTITGLRQLDALAFLDLSNNQIVTFDNDELPERLVVLNLKGNDCTKHDSYLEAVLAACPYLTQLDDKQVTKDQRRQLQLPVSDDEDDDDENLADPASLPAIVAPVSDASPLSPNSSAKQIQELTSDMLQRAHQRKKEDEAELAADHKAIAEAREHSKQQSGSTDKKAIEPAKC
jgi:hypothetical protein